MNAVDSSNFNFSDSNNIKKLNGRAFNSLSKLVYVDVQGNDCINEYFTGAARMTKMPQVLSERCGFNDNELFVRKIAKLEADLKLEAKAELQTAYHNEIKTQLKETCDARAELKAQEISNCSNDLQAKTAEINEKNEKIKEIEKKNQILGETGPW